MGLDTSEIEKKLRGEDDESLRAILKQRLEEVKGHQFKTYKKKRPTLNLKTINESIGEF